MTASARVHVIGVPPGAASLPEEVREAVASCRLLAGAVRHLELIPGFSGETCPLEGRLSELLQRLEAEPGLTAAVLASGDPGFFGVAGALVRRLSAAEVRVWPAVSSMQVAFARVGEPWSDARFASLHGRPLENLAAVLGAPRIGLFTDPENGPARVARYLVESGWAGLEMVVAEDLGLTTERVRRGAVPDFEHWQGSPLNVVLLLGGDRRLAPLGPGLPDEGFAHSGGLITKAEVRAVALGRLRLRPGGVLWDVGAGSGSVSVEACLLFPGLLAYAVEKEAGRLEHIRENRRRFRAAGVVPVAGEAPGVLGGLPDPDAVFIGGSGGEPARLLQAAWQRLRPGGTLVAAAVLVETLCDILSWARGVGVEGDLLQVACSRSRPLGARRRWEPLSPVTLFRARREGGGP